MLKNILKNVSWNTVFTTVIGRPLLAQRNNNQSRDEKCVMLLTLSVREAILSLILGKTRECTASRWILSGSKVRTRGAKRMPWPELRCSKLWIGYLTCSLSLSVALSIIRQDVFIYCNIMVIEKKCSLMDPE